jgi:hypothetical protein
MKTIALVLLFLGVLLIIRGLYEDKYQSLKKNTKIEYRFIPRTYYEEQLNNDMNVSSNFKNMFNKELWVERNITIPKTPKD